MVGLVVYQPRLRQSKNKARYVAMVRYMIAELPPTALWPFCSLTEMDYTILFIQNWATICQPRQKVEPECEQFCGIGIS